MEAIIVITALAAMAAHIWVCVYLAMRRTTTERQRDELLIAMREVADSLERHTWPGHPTVMTARAAIANAEAAK